MNKWTSRLMGAFAGLLLAPAAWAELPHGTLQFITPNVTVGPNDPVQIWVRLTLDANSPAFNFSSLPLTGFSAADLPTQGWRYDTATSSYINSDFALITQAYIGAGLGCCSAAINGNYVFEFGTTLNPNVPGLVYQDHFNLAPGQSYDYLFAQFTPKAGGATAGTYSAVYAETTLSFGGFDGSGNWLNSIDRPVVAGTCENLNNAACTFTFTVAVPEPSSYVMLAVGLVAVGGVARRRTRREA